MISTDVLRQKSTSDRDATQHLVRERRHSEMTGGDAIARSLLAHGADTVFGIPGAQIYGLFDAFQRAGGMRVIGPRHEQACAYMAFGYARSSGRPGVFAVVPGPGILNTSAAMLTALACNQPVLALTGQVPTAFLGRGRGHLHEMPDQLGTLRGVSKWAARIEHAADAPETVARAFQAMRSGRHGPALVETPWDVFTSTTPLHEVEPFSVPAAPILDPVAVERAAALVAKSRAPMILVGSGAVAAGREVKELAETLGAPVIAFRGGRGVLDDDHDLAGTLAVGARLWENTDLVIGIGSRLELPGWRWPQRPGIKQIRIDIDPVELRRSRPDAPVLADAVAGTAALLDAVRADHLAIPSQRERILAIKTEVAQKIQSLRPHAAYLRAIREVLPRDGFLVDEMCQAGFASWFAFPVHQPRTLVTSGYQGTLGFGFPTALGVKVANPDRAVVSISGDGGFMFAVQELATAVQHCIGVVAVMFNNSSYGNVRRDQQTAFASRLIGCDLVNPDFVKLANAFGVFAERVSSPDALRPALEKAFADGGPRMIEVTVPLDSETSPWPFIEPRSVPAGRSQ